MNQVKFPALVGDSPLAILAAIGALRLVRCFVDPSARLAWDPEDHCPVLHSELSSLDAVAESLADVIASLPEGVVVPGGPVGFPPPGTAPDRLRIPLGELKALTERWEEGLSDTEAEVVRAWLSSLVTDLTADAGGRGAISQFAAPSGKQSTATMLEKPLELVSDKPEYLRQALAGWRRVPGVTGEYLDHRAAWDRADDPRGEAEMRGVPGATWLALMSFPLWLTTAAQRRVRSSGWHTVAAGRRTTQELRLPLWREALGPSAIRALVEHPALAGETSPLDARLRLLGVFHVCRARRQPTAGGKSAGLLGPVP